CTVSVTYTPNANTSGTDSFTFKVNDGMVDSSPATVSITINFVNDVPSFTKGADQSANKGASAQTVMGWATSISPGPGSNESGKTGQSFTVTTTGSPSGASMVIGETGTLPTGVMFTDNHNGTATINGTPAANTQGTMGNPVSQAYPLTLSADNNVPPPASQAF